MTRKPNVKGGWQGSRVSEEVRNKCVEEYLGGESACVVGGKYGVHAKSVYLWVEGRGGEVRRRKEACWLRHGKKIGKDAA
jgi:transposase-like protein